MWYRLIYHSEVNYALRQSIVLCLPVIVGLIFSGFQQGIIFALAPACCNIAGLDQVHKHFFKRLIIGSLLFSSSSIIIQILLFNNVPLPLAILGLAIIFGISGEISPLHSRLLPASLVSSVFTIGLIGNVSFWIPPIIYLCGTIWYGLFNTIWFRLWKEQPMREALSVLYRELANYLEAKYSLLTNHLDPRKALPPLFIRQQKVIDQIEQVYQQLYMMSKKHFNQYRKLICSFQVAMDLQEHIAVSLHQPEEVQKLIRQSQAETVLRYNSYIISSQLRILADDILYHRKSSKCIINSGLLELKKIAYRNPNNPVGQFCYFHFNRIYILLRSLKPLYNRNIMEDNKQYLSFFSSIKNYFSFNSMALRNSIRLGLMLSIGSSLGIAFNLPKSYWILITIMFVSQNGYNATRIRIQHRALGTIAGLIIAYFTLQLNMNNNIILIGMLLITIFGYLVLRKNYGLSITGMTIVTVYTLQLLSLNGTYFLLPRLVDTLIGCMISFGGTLWLWPQWQSGLLRTNAYQALEQYKKALQLLLIPNSNLSDLVNLCIRVNQVHNTLFTSLSQAMQEPGFNSRYLSDMRLWVTHSQFIVEHINAMISLSRDNNIISDNLATNYLINCEKALNACQKKLKCSGSTTKNIEIFDKNEKHKSITLMERHLKRILFHLNIMYTISSIAWMCNDENNFNK